MSRDYSSRRNSQPSRGKRATPSRRRAAARSAPRKRSSGGPPGWLWMLCGLCMGLIVAAGFYVFGRPAGTPAREQISIAAPTQSASAGEKSTAADEPADGAAPTKKEEEPRFSFYKMLPNYEVVIPEEEYPEHNSESASSAHSAPAASATKPRAPQPTTPKVEEPGNYIIQAGSFSTFADADRRKAELALLGVSAQIVDVDLASGKTVYRVQSNTIGSSDKLNDTLKRLRENRIDTLVMRAKN